MQIRIYDNFSQIPLARDEWNALIHRSATTTIFQTHQWASAWWQIFGDRHKLLYMAVEDAGQIRGFAPLMAASTGGAGNALHFLADANSDYCDFASDGNRYAVLDTLVRYFAREHAGWDSLTLRNIPEQSPTLAALMTLCMKHGLWPHLSRRIAAPRIVFAPDDREFKLKYSVRRHCNRMERLGKVEFRILHDRRDLPRMLDALYEQHVGRYQLKGEHSLFENTQFRSFYALLANELMDAGWLHFSELLLDDQPIALHYGFKYNKVLTWYKPAFDITHRQYSPGTVLIKHLIDYASEHRLDALDFTIGNEPFKDRFSNAVNYNRNLTIYRNRPSAYFDAMKDKAFVAAKQIMTALGISHAPGKRHHPHA